jgi:haloalkane dehalogenase
METLRTPDERFENLPGYNFEPHYVEVDGLRIHYVDEGTGPTVLLMHGEPSWAYLYRHMIPVLTAGGCRAVAPDLVGFGRSDKPAKRDDYTYARHVEWMSKWLEAVDLTDITLVCQDWGSLIGLRLVAAYPERFARFVVANGGMPTGDQKPTEAFLNWQNFSQTTPEFPVGVIINGGTTTDLSPEIIAAYDAPFPDESYKEGARQFPLLVPTSPDDPASEDNRNAWKVLESFTKPVLTAFSDKDGITKGGYRVFQERVPGAKGQPHTTIEGGGHFLQEDRGPELAQVVLDFIASTS